MEEIVEDYESQDSTVRIAVEPDYFPQPYVIQCGWKIGSITYVGANPVVIIYPLGFSEEKEVPIFL